MAEPASYAMDAAPPAYDAEPPAKRSEPEANIGLDRSFLRTKLGLSVIANMVLTLLGIIVMAAAAEPYYWFDNFIYASTCVLFAFGVVFGIHLFQVHKVVKQIHWPLTLLINCGLWAFVMFISSIMALSKARYSTSTGGVVFAGIVGLITMASIILEGVIHLYRFRETRHEHGGVWCCVVC